MIGGVLVNARFVALSGIRRSTINQDDVDSGGNDRGRTPAAPVVLHDRAQAGDGVRVPCLERRIPAALRFPS